MKNSKNSPLPASSWRILAIDDEELIHDTYSAIFCDLLEGSGVDKELDELESFHLHELDGESERAVDCASKRYRLDKALTGREGLTKVIEAHEADDPYAVIFLDMRMPPGWDGLETAVRIRKVDQSVRIILVTAYMDYELKEIRDQIGYDFAFLSKPVDPAALLQMTELFAVQWMRATELVALRGTVSNLSEVNFDELYPIKIMLVDDSATIRAVYGEMLKRHRQYEVKTAGSMEEALELAEHFQPDLSIIDHLMPNGDGSELTSKLLAQERTKTCLVVVLTSSKEIEQTALEAGAIDVIYKDDPIEVFIQRIHSIERYLRSQYELRVKILTETQAQQKQHWLESIIAGVPDGLLVFGGDSKLQNINRSALRMFGQPSTALKGRTLDSILSEYAEESEDARVDYLIKGENREPLPVSVEHISMSEVDHSLNGELIVLDDLTNLLKMESVEQTSKAKDLFLASMSHELRTPLSAIIGNSQLLKQITADEGLLEIAHSIEKAGQMQLSLVNDILDMSKLESGKFTIDEAPFDLSLLLHEIKQTFSVQAKEVELLFTVEQRNREEMKLIGDAQRITQILINLVGNAIKFTPEGEVTLATWVEGNQLIFQVKDSGIGISAEDQDYLFRRFEQADQSISKRFGGTGLGLFISKSLAELMQGRIEVFSVEGEGATFELILPYHQSDIALQRGEDDGHSIKQPKPVKQRVAHILVAEDTPLLQSLERRMLERLGLTVTIAENGQEAVTLASESEYDLILMDMQMPVMDGIEATRRLREKNNWTPIVAVTANVMKRHKDAFNEAGCDGFLAKPFEEAALKAVLDTFLDAQ